jgi:hypothetical protein
MHQWIEIDNVSMVILNLREDATVKSVVRHADLPDHPASHLRLELIGISQAGPHANHPEL